MKKYLIIILGLLSLQSCRTSSHSEEEQATPILLSSLQGKASCVYLTSDEKNNPIVSWCEIGQDEKKYFYLASFDENTHKFTTPILIPLPQNAVLHEEGMPKVAIKGDGSIVVVYETSLPTKSNKWAGGICFVQSSNQGKTWSQPRFIHSDTAANGVHSFASIARLGNGEIGACWLDESQDKQNNGRPIKFASTKGDKGFQNEILIDPSACECCRTAVSSSADGKISVVYRGLSNASVRDITVSKSTDDGKSFGRPISFSHDNWMVNGCPHNGPGTISTDKATYAVWYTGGSQKGVFYGELDNNNHMTLKKQISADGRNIQLCLLSDGTRVLAYSEQAQEKGGFYSKIMVNKTDGNHVFAKEVFKAKTQGLYPVLMPLQDDKIVVAWNENGKVYYTLVDTKDINKEVVVDGKIFDSKETTVGTNQLAIYKDPVCGMSLDEPQEKLSVNGITVGFCSKSCKDRFVENSSKYKLE